MHETIRRTHAPAPGIALRMKLEARRMAAQHRTLAALREEIRDSLTAHSLASAERAFERFSEMLDAHFQVEEEIHFPSVRSTWREMAGEMDDLVQDHRRLRRQVARVRGSFARGNGFECAITLGRLLEQVVRHEQVEEAILKRLPSATASRSVGAAIGPGQ
jgi:hypothetical protein